MSTINISLPSEQITFIDSLTNTYGFASRSEFIRSLIRLIANEPTLVKKAATFPFVTPKEKSVKKIIADFEKTKKYSPAFLEDLKEGLKSSDCFQE